MEKEELRIAFARVRQDIQFIFNELLSLRKDLETIKKEVEEAKNMQKMAKNTEKEVQHISNTNPTHLQHMILKLKNLKELSLI